MTHVSVKECLTLHPGLRSYLLTDGLVKWRAGDVTAIVVDIDRFCNIVNAFAFVTTFYQNIDDHTST